MFGACARRRPARAGPKHFCLIATDEKATIKRMAKPQKTESLYGRNTKRILELLFFSVEPEKGSISAGTILSELGLASKSNEKLLREMAKKGLIRLDDPGLGHKNVKVILTNRGREMVERRCLKKARRLLFRLFDRGGGDAMGYCHLRNTGAKLGMEGYLADRIGGFLVRNGFADYTEPRESFESTRIRITESGISELREHLRYRVRIALKREPVAKASFIVAVLALLVGLCRPLKIIVQPANVTTPPAKVDVTVPVPQVNVTVPVPDVKLILPESQASDNAVTEKTNDKSKPVTGTGPATPDAKPPPN